MTPVDAPKRTGRRPGKPDTRGEVLAAAQRTFERVGYAAATIRGIARDAAVDPALVHRWFGDKRGLFLATMRSGFDPVAVIERLVAGGPDNLGPRIALTAMSVWESPMGRSWVELVRRSPGMLPAAVGFLNDPITAAAMRLLGLSEAEARLRVAVVESIMVGTVTTRYMTRLEPLASMPREEVTRIMAPLLQHAITGDLGVAPARRGAGAENS